MVRAALDPQGGPRTGTHRCRCAPASGSGVEKALPAQRPEEVLLPVLGVLGLGRRVDGQADLRVEILLFEIHPWTGRRATTFHGRSPLLWHSRAGCAGLWAGGCRT